MACPAICQVPKDLTKSGKSLGRLQEWGGRNVYLEAVNKELKKRQTRRGSVARKTSRGMAGEEAAGRHFHCCFRHYSRTDSSKGRQSGTVRRMVRRRQQQQPAMLQLIQVPSLAAILVYWH